MSSADKPSTLPEGPLLAYYGDDFTGSTDVMEAFTLAGVPTVLFLQAPTPKWVARFAHMRCIGLAGTSRGRSPAWMREHLPAAFASLKAFGAPLLQYKVCSTFDSSPATGSIGAAIDLGVAAMGGAWSPMVVGAPRLRRYQAFGQLFAAVGDTVHRLDRHPTMSRHPVTPMDEADLRQHLARQTPRRTDLIDLVALKNDLGPQRLQAALGSDGPVVLLDVIDDQTLALAGQLVWDNRGAGLFSASSSGLAYALVAHWRHAGLLDAPPSLPPTRAVAGIAAISGSCSPVTAAQIAWAADHGFDTLRMDVGAVLSADGFDPEVQRLLGAAQAAVARGTSPLIYSASGPDDPAVLGFAGLAQRAGLTLPLAHERVGQALATTMRRIVDTTGVRRIAIAGGDSSGAVASALDIAALTVATQLAPGAPLCRAHATSTMDGLEVVLKGGQMGQPDFFERVLQGTA
ncbi:MAG TPA: type III effector [Hydrogenophaga sp.]|uniref:3-oxo-isoapionate kinase OiaK n=1 Tax=Hydrogenophaga sp. TaxID=1904254 RepID=UPI0008D048D8|nr:3-oxo-isoapionate kinase OiaK [Hydrogenophaga sp.]OGA75520.1 MAG: type III effector [Burkholderiales bacterium GWE1_65_30]OGA93646.1 MAG: type III effector [Burkholderiales bacterium GWF1_66_17]HAX20254.1 type III effector [Hydrogenophaga sp.]HBU18590.1 type III effector [Hydrogenophaga sp.]